MGKWFEIFRAGNYPQGNFGQREIGEIEQNFNKEDGAPVVIGHPKENKPVYGIVDAIKKQGDLLLARFAYLSPGLVQAVNNGLYKKVSVRLVNSPEKGWRLVHVGFLGAKTPGVQGLKPINFSYKEPETAVDFANQNFNEAEGVIQGKSVPVLADTEAEKLYQQAVDFTSSSGKTFEEAAVVVANRTEYFYGQPVDKQRLVVHLRIIDFAAEKGIKYQEAFDLMEQKKVFEDVPEAEEISDYESSELHRKVLAYAKKHGMEYSDAALEVAKVKS